MRNWYRTLPWLAICIFVFNGCVVEQVGRTIAHTVKGEYYMEANKFAKGETFFRQEVKQNPSDASAHYYLGRILLAREEAAEAQSHLREAVQLNNDNSDYHFWLGVSYGALKQTKQERQSYLNALKYEPKHLQALIYLGHNYLEDGALEQALERYDKALELWPQSPSVLYNRALIFKKMGRLPEEELAWLTYLDNYPSGAMARRAADALNVLGNFDYRNFQIGLRTITLEKIIFEPFGADLDSRSFPSLELLGSAVSRMKKGVLHVVAYQTKNKRLAKKRAQAVRDYLVDKTDLDRHQIKISWFDVPEEVSAGQSKHKLHEYIFFVYLLE